MPIKNGFTECIAFGFADEGGSGRSSFGAGDKESFYPNFMYHMSPFQNSVMFIIITA